MIKPATGSVIRAARKKTGPGPQAALPQADTMLRILATTDLHMHLLPWDYFADRPSRNRGLSLLAGLIAQARAEVTHSLLLDNGDFLQGSPIGDFLAETAALPPGAVHPMIAAMNRLSYDATCLGNHEFSHGLEFLQNALTGAEFPALSANILTHRGAGPATDVPLVPPTSLITRWVDMPDGTARRLTIGVIGLTPPQVVNWERVLLGDRLQARSAYEAARHHLAALRAAGADLVVALAHSGLGDATTALDHENTVSRLARDLTFDAIIAGHVHNVFPGPDFAAGDGLDPVTGLVWGTPTVMPGFYGSHLGVIDLHLKAKPDAGWQVVGQQVALRPVFRRTPRGTHLAAVREDDEIRQIALPAHVRTRRWARRKIGETEADLHSFFALVSPSASVALVAQAQADFVARALHGTVWEGVPILSAAAPFRTGGRSGPDNYTFVPKGPISLRNVSDLYSFPNTIIGLLLSGAEVGDWLERAAAQFNTVPQGARDAALINTDMPGFDFDLILGLTYDFDLSRPARYDAAGRLLDPAAARVVNIRWNNAPLDPSARFVLATNSYRIGGGGGYDTARDSKVILRGGQAIRSILAAHLAGKGSLDAQYAPIWRFVPMADTTVTFLSAPAAKRFMDEMPAGRISALDQTDKGFQRFRLIL